MRSKASQRIKDRKRLAREKRNRRCRNMGTLYGNTARLQQETVENERTTLWMTLANFFKVPFAGPRANKKDWEK